MWKSGSEKAATRKMSILSFSLVDTEMGRPYNPPIADAATPNGADDEGKTLKSKRDFRFQAFRFR